MKRILFILAGVIVVIGLVSIVYFLFFRGSSPALVIENPFDGLGGTNSDVQPNENNLEPGEILQGAGTEVAPRFFKITDGPVVPQTVAFEIQIPQDIAPLDPDSTTTPETYLKPDTEVRYIERASGNIYSFITHERTLTRLGNRTLPGIQQASWTPDGSRAFVFFLSSDSGTDLTEAYALPATGEGGYFLETGLTDVKVFGSNTLVTLLSSNVGSTATVAGVDGSSPRTLFTSSLSALHLHTASSTFVAATKGSSGLDGYAFTVSPSTGAFSRILGPLRGLSVLPSTSGNQVLYSYVVQGAPRMNIYDRNARTSTPLPLATLSEKCAWASDESALYCAIPRSFTGNLPDDWYQGALTTSDRIWRIDLEARLAVLVIDPQEAAEVSIDAVSLTLDPKMDVLTFVNKTDGSLWLYDL